MSTPCGKRGFFYDAWAHGGERWTRMAVKATECDRIPADFLDDERAELGSAWFRQEYLCEFLDNGRSVVRKLQAHRARQAEVLDWTAKRGLLACSRQLGELMRCQAKGRKAGDVIGSGLRFYHFRIKRGESLY
jgi:hypothetical protein